MSRTLYAKRAFAAVITTLTLVGSSAGIALAAGPIGTTVSPPVYDLAGKGGEVIVKKMTVHNDSSAPQSYTSVVNTIAPANEEGGLAFGPASTADLSGWITVSPAKLDLAPNESADFNITIKVPAAAAAGGHYATVFAKSESSTQVASGASVTSMVGTSILLKVSGSTVESADVVEFSTSRARLTPGEPIDFSVRMRNTGNVHVRPQGTIQIYRDSVKMDEVAINSDGLNVLPSSIRKFVGSSNKTLPSGSYTAKLALTYGAGQAIAVPAISFVVVGESSMATMVAIILGIFVLILIAALMVNRRKPTMGKK